MPAVLQRKQTSFKWLFDPADYGSLFNGVDDDAPGIRDAMADASAAYNNGGGVVQLPPTRVNIYTPVLLLDGVWCRGCGSTTDIRAGSNDIFKFAGSGTGPDNIMLSDFIMLGSGRGINLDATGMTGGNRLGWMRLVLSNITASDMGNSCFYQPTTGPIETRYINCVVLRCTGTGFSIGATDNLLISCTAAECTGDGFSLAGGNNKMANCKAYGCDGSGFTLIGAGRHMIAGCESQDNTYAGYNVVSNSNIVEGCLSDTDGVQVRIQGSNNQIDVNGIHGGGGTGMIPKFGVLFDGDFGASPKGNKVRMVTSATVPVGGEASKNDVDVTALEYAERKVYAYATPFTPQPYLARTAVITLTGNLVVNTPTLRHTGQRFTLDLTQDGTGGRTVTFPTSFSVNWTPDTGANKRNIITFEFDGQRWNQVAAVVGMAPLILTAGDTFNRADGAVGTSSTGHVWSISMGGAGGFNVISNQLGLDPGSGQFVLNYAWIDVGVDDYTLQFDAIAGDPMVIFRYTDRNNLVMITNQVISVVAGVSTAHSSTSAWGGSKVGHTFKIVVSGNTVTIFRDGVQTFTGGFSGNSVGGKVGFLMQALTDRVDNMVVT